MQGNLGAAESAHGAGLQCQGEGGGAGAGHHEGPVHTGAPQHGQQDRPGAQSQGASRSVSILCGSLPADKQPKIIISEIIINLVKRESKKFPRL